MDQVSTQAVVDESSIFSFFMSVVQLHRTVLDVMADQMAAIKISDLNPVQVMLLCSLGEKQVSSGDLKKYGHYKGSNVTYTLNELVRWGYVNREKNPNDGRMVIVSLTKKGLRVRQRVLAALDCMKGMEEIMSHSPLLQGIGVMELALINTIRHIR